jgi:hypothetical protein
MKMCDIETGSKIYTECSDGSTYITFHDLVGLYSYCETEKGGVVYLSSSTALNKKNDGYVIEAHRKH